MSWQDRLTEDIELVSPDGNVFFANWIGDPRTIEKKVGIFTYPKVSGAVVQDLDVDGTTYQLTIYFEGEDHDKDSAEFFTACSENGIWDITHPVRGILNLQLLSVTEEIQPVTSGNITRFLTEWIEPLPPSQEETASSLAGEIEKQVESVNESSLGQFQTILQNSYEAVQAIQTTVDKVTSKVKKILSPIYKVSATINSRIESIHRSITDLIAEPFIDLAGVAGQIQNLFQLPILAVEDTRARLSAYTTMAAELTDLTPTGSNQVSYNIAAVQELAMTANQTAIAQIAATSIGISSTTQIINIPAPITTTPSVAATQALTFNGTIQTRAQAIEFSEIVSQAFSDITVELDESQELFVDTDIDKQFFSQSQSFYDTALLTALAVKYLLVASYDLKKEKRFTLRQPKSPIGITIEEYGGLGDNDENFDLFIESNSLKANDILLLPAGREVVVYV